MSFDEIQGELRAIRLEMSPARPAQAPTCHLPEMDWEELAHALRALRSDLVGEDLEDSADDLFGDQFLADDAADVDMWAGCDALPLESDADAAVRADGERILRIALWEQEREQEQESARAAYSLTESRETYRAHCEQQWKRAEDWCRGNLLNRKATAKGINPRALFSGPATIAYARASEDLTRFWADVEPRITFAQWDEMQRGTRTEAANRARQTAHNHLIAA
ncbi:hypothetical protein Scani_34770 [Streptomyces caniferus]|uniref:Uncharacterized protein n=1 Tax=Streptomyces caniferus TaxID=285557 RepID=A0A640S7I2_9ACTN|nr:hypothetical protein [Streptomyces caniferus]GFE07209.1 hypothetical protein Scani_34770 [Streptomyces caniferus]